MIGSLVNGKMTDLVGRRGMMWFSEIFSAAGWLAIAFAQNVWWLDLGRLSVGFGVGILRYVVTRIAVPVYIAEITPTDLRGRFTSATQLMLCCGVALMYFLGNIIPWQTLALIGAVPSLVHIAGLFFIPESPRWLAKLGRHKDFEETLQRIRGKNTDTSQEAADIMEYTEMFQQNSERVLDLFERRYARSLIIGVGLMSLQQFGGTNAVAYYASSIFVDAGFSSSVGTIFERLIMINMFSTIFVDVSIFVPISKEHLLGLYISSGKLIEPDRLTEVEISISNFEQSSFMGVLLALKWVLENANRWLYETKLGAKQYRLPPGDMGWPFIGNIWSFLRAFKSNDPDSFINSFVSRLLHKHGLQQGNI